MRIDFHTHTKKCKSGDGSSRTISPEEFIKKMEDNDVVMCAITNHNKFSKNEFERIESLEHNFTIFPGIELDIHLNKKVHHHVILICDPSEKDHFYNCFDNDSNRNYDDFIMNYDDLIHNITSFPKEKIIIIPHFLDKDKKRAFSIDEKEQLINDLRDYIVILEPGKITTMGIINSHEELSLLGSDVKDWNNYSKYELPEIKFRIKSFGSFYELAKDPKEFIKQELKSIHKDDIKIDNKDDTIPIYNDINIVFGEKGSGKTVLMTHYLEPHLKKIGKKIMFHQGKDYNQKYHNLLDEYIKSIEVNEDLKEKIKDNFDFVLSYKEDIIPDFVFKITEYLESKNSNKNAEKIAKTDTRFSEVNTDDFNSLYKNASRCIEKIDDVIKINIELRNKTNKSMMTTLNNELNKLKEDVINQLKLKYKNIFIINETKKILDIIKGSVSKKTGKKPAIDNIGFANLIASRLKFMKEISELRNNLASIEDYKETKKLGYLPQKGIITLVVNVITLSENYKYKSGSVFNRNSITEYRKLVSKLSHFVYGEFKNINNYFTPQERDTRGNDFVLEVIKKESYIEREDGEKYEPSEGEKAILSISGLLENTDYDCYLFDEIERGLGNKYISNYLIPKLIDLREKNKMIIISTHNANIATNTLPSQCIYCEYKNKTSNAYYFGDMYSGKLAGSMDSTEILDWEEKALEHLEGSQNMFNRRKNLYGIE